ncbi:superoxide dismutase [Aurantiacibacter aquimixticola]|uniref:Superoxide dismutase n=1 Tax=Aurantiacibacter aquimixticola TaxID=1958945 RepID=A0A419RTV9_9SPHN|nr:superoxide dismutase [Aurantiacibacter aquimixticola]RJY09209.1 superoxide dismutase [Aurantiacibacter aquimixticola]
MAFTLIDLPYDKEAIAPAITAETFNYHHGKHHQAYVNKTNDAIEGTDHADKPLEDIVAASRGSDQGLFNNSAQTWNHGFYWHSLTPQSTGPSGELAAKIEESFGSLAELKDQLKSKGAGHFASGWVWLVEKDGKLSVVDTHDADTVVDQGHNPLLVIDLWEHAYYLDHQNARPSYLDAVVDNHLNWDFAADNLSRGTVWTYPN